jgi:hypothetical protein
MPASATPITDDLGPIGGATDIDEVIARMERIAAALPATDGVACFNRIYLAATEAVREALAAGRFADPPFMARLDPVFANLYFDALDGWADGRTPRAWSPLLAARGRSDVLPLQFAFAGMNAHINRDLMIAVVQVCAERDLVPARGTPQHADYLLINQLLAAEQAELKSQYLPPPLATADRASAGLDDLLAMWSIDEARDAAWSHAETLYALRDHALLSASYIDTIDGLVGLASRGLLRPLPSL